MPPAKNCGQPENWVECACCCPEGSAGAWSVGRLQLVACRPPTTAMMNVRPRRRAVDAREGFLRRAGLRLVIYAGNQVNVDCRQGRVESAALRGLLCFLDAHDGPGQSVLKFMPLFFTQQEVIGRGE